MGIVGKDEKGRIWFKSDWFLSDITNAIDFAVHDDSFLWSKWFKITAKVPYDESIHGIVKKDGYQYHPKYFDQIIGWYTTLRDASMALESLMLLKGIKEMSLIDGKFK